MHLYLATGIAGADADDRLAPDEDERLELRARCRSTRPCGLVWAATIRDAKSILGILWLDRLRRLEDAVAAVTDAAARPTPPRSIRERDHRHLGAALGPVPRPHPAVHRRRQRAHRVQPDAGPRRLARRRRRPVEQVEHPVLGPRLEPRALVEDPDRDVLVVVVEHDPDPPPSCGAVLRRVRQQVAHDLLGVGVVARDRPGSVGGISSSKRAPGQRSAS